MEKISDILETYRQSIPNPPSMTTSDESDIPDSLPYRPNTHCPVCDGAGFVHPREKGQVDYTRVIPCRETGCLQSSVRGNVREEVARQTFETFVETPGSEKALKAAKALAYREAKFIWLLIYGRPGNGKSHLCNAIVRVVRDNGHDVRMILAADFFSLLREAIRDNKTDMLLRRFKEVFFLAIDDYGVEYGSEWEQAKFDELMTFRYAAGKPTVLITNKDISTLPSRISSRFNDGAMARICHNTAPDYRRTRK